MVCVAAENSVIPVGTVCHEETIGDYASYVNIQNNQSYLGNEMGCDYKMVDSDWLLMPSAARYFLQLPQGAGRAQNFTATPSTLQKGGNYTYGQLMNLNAGM